MRFLILIALLAAPLSAQPITWETVDGPPGGLLPVMHETGNGILLVVDEIGRMGRSADSGDTWATVDLQGVNSFSNAPGETLAATDAGVYRSTDDGATWTFVVAGPSALHSVARADDTTFVATGPLTGQWQRTIYQSSDNGASWRSLGSEAASPAVRAQDGRVYYSAGLGFTPFGYPNRHLIYRWEAGEWMQLSTSDDLITGFFGGLDAAGAQVFFATHGESISGTRVGGLHRRPIETGQTGGWTYDKMEASALLVQGPGVWYVGGQGRVIRYGQAPSGVAIEQRTELGGTAPITSLIGSGDLFASGTALCEETLDSPPLCDDPGVPVRIAASDGAIQPIGFGQARVRLVVNDGDDVLALTDRAVWQLEEDCTGMGCSAVWTQVSATAPPRADLVFDLTRTPWGVIYASASALYWPSLFVQSKIDGEWESAINFSTLPIFVAAPNDTTLFLGSEDGLSQSTDQGKTFDIVLDTPIRSLYDDRSWGVRVGTDDGVFLTDGAILFQEYDTTPFGPVHAVEVFLGGDFVALSILAGRTVFLGGARGGDVLPDSVEPSGSRFIPQVNSWLVTDRAVWRPSFADTLEQIYASRKPEPCSGYLEKCVFHSLSAASMVNGRDISVFLSTPTGLLRTTEAISVGVDDRLRLGAATFRIAPNPASGRATIALPTGTIQADVFDLTGRRVASLEVQSETSEWDSTPHAPGLYLVRAVTPTGVVSRAVIVAR